MSYDDFWNGDVEMVKYYRKANELQVEQRNFELWLQGMYIYEAVRDLAPVLNALSKNREPEPYRREPIPLTEANRLKAEEEDKKRRLADGKAKMEQLMASINKQFEKGGIENGSTA